MLSARLLPIADQVIHSTAQRLPEPIRVAAAECLAEPVLMADCLADGEAFEEDLLGVFEGFSRAEPEPEAPEQFPRIRLFVDNLWDYVGGDLSAFRAEVKKTYLHELGHYLGFDEAAVEELGLG